MTTLIPDHIFQLYFQTYVTKRLSFIGRLKIGLDDIEFVRQHCFQVFTVGVANLYFARFGRWFTTEFYDFVGEVMCVQLLVGDFGEKNLFKLRSVRTGGFGCLYGKLYNRTKFGGQILV